MTTHHDPAASVLTEAARTGGLDATEATLLRDGSNILYQLPGSRVARIGQAGTLTTAERELTVARWLISEGVSVARPLERVPQPIVVNDQPVTWWEHIPNHRHGTTAELGALLRQLHTLSPQNAPTLAQHDPFVGLAERVSSATHLPDDERHWLDHRLTQLQDNFSQLEPPSSQRVIHGDAWQGNVAVPATGQPLLLDLEHVAVGDPYWDLIPIAVDFTDFARLNTSDYHTFVDAYGGHDVTASANFRTLADIQELRWVSFILHKAANNKHAEHEARHRIACLRGEHQRPWTWHAF